MNSSANTIESAFHSASEHFQAGRLIEADAICQQILQVMPNQPDTLHLLGIIAHQIGMYDVAVELISGAIDQTPNFFQAHYNIANAYRAQGLLDEAVASYMKAIAIKPDYVIAYNNLGDILQTQGKLAKAAACYQAALEVRPDLVDVLFNLGNVLHEQGLLDEAIVSYQKAVSLNPAYADAYNELGIIFKKQGRLRDAVDSYHQALSFNPEYSEAYYAALHDLGQQIGPDKVLGKFHGTVQRKAVVIIPESLTDGAYTHTRFCVDPWHYLEIGAEHGLKPCCNMPPIAVWTPDGLEHEELRNSQEFRALRRELMTGRLNDFCLACHIRPIVPIEQFQATFFALIQQAGCDLLMPRPLHHLRVDITTDCNLRCVYCSVSQPWYVRTEMPATSFDSIIDLLRKQPKDIGVLVNGHGETTYHREWVRLCNEIIELGFRPSITTNLARPFTEEEVTCLSGFGTVQISMDTVDPVQLKNIRRRVKLSNIIDNINNIRAAATIKNQPAPLFSISCGVYDLNYADLEKLVDFCIEFKIHSVTFWQLVKYDGDIPDTLNVYPITSLEKDRIVDAIAHMDRTVALLHEAGIATEIAGDFIEEWRGKGCNGGVLRLFCIRLYLIRDR